MHEPSSSAPGRNEAPDLNPTESYWTLYHEGFTCFASPHSMVQSACLHKFSDASPPPAYSRLNCLNDNFTPNKWACTKRESLQHAQNFPNYFQRNTRMLNFNLLYTKDRCLSNRNFLRLNNIQAGNLFRGTSRQPILCFGDPETSRMRPYR